MIWVIVSLIILPFAVGYAFGSIPFGLIIAKLGGAGDVRSIGSGNIGATNVLRTGRKSLALATLLGDMLKGTIPVALFISADPEPAAMAAIGAFIGHLYPIWLKFKGGKGVATYIGAIIPFSWIVLLAFAAVWLATALATRYSSLSALLATLVVPIVFWQIGLSEGIIAATFAIMTALCWLKHRDNIKRLLAGSESRIGQKG